MSNFNNDINLVGGNPVVAAKFLETPAGQEVTKGAVNLVTIIVILCILSCCSSCCSSFSNIAGMCATGNSLVTKFTTQGLSIDCGCLCVGILFPPLLVPVLAFICLRYMLMFSGQCKKLKRSLTKSKEEDKEST